MALEKLIDIANMDLMVEKNAGLSANQLNAGLRSMAKKKKKPMLTAKGVGEAAKFTIGTGLAGAGLYAASN